MALESMRRAFADDPIRQQLLDQQKYRRDRLSEMHNATQKGLQQGRELGLEQGREQGALQSKLEIARRLLETGMDREQVRQLAELTLEELSSL